MGNKSGKNCGGWSKVPTSQEQKQSFKLEKHARINEQQIKRVTQKDDRNLTVDNEDPLRVDVAMDWRPRTPSNPDSAKIALLKKPFKSLIALLRTYPHIVYLAYSLWRKVIVMSSSGYTSDLGEAMVLGNYFSDGNLHGVAGELRNLEIPRMFLEPTVVEQKCVRQLRMERRPLSETVLAEVVAKMGLAAKRKFWRLGKPYYDEDYEGTCYPCIYPVSLECKLAEFFRQTIRNNQLDVMAAVLKYLRLQLNDSWHTQRGWHTIVQQPTLIQEAAEHGSTQMVKMLLRANRQDVDTRRLARISDETILHSAVQGGNTETLRLLLEIDDSQINEKCVYNRTPLDLGLKVQASVAILNLLLAHGGKAHLYPYGVPKKQEDEKREDYDYDESDEEESEGEWTVGKLLAKRKNKETKEKEYKVLWAGCTEWEEGATSWELQSWLEEEGYDEMVLNYERQAKAVSSENQRKSEAGCKRNSR